jgi:hypothetical protein
MEALTSWLYYTITLSVLPCPYFDLVGFNFRSQQLSIHPLLPFVSTPDLQDLFTGRSTQHSHGDPLPPIIGRPTARSTLPESGVKSKAGITTV